MKLNPIFQNGLVLAMNKPIRVFGEGTGTVSVRFLGETVCATSRQNEWCVELAPQSAGGPYEMQVELNGVSTILEDVYVGVVLLLHGQSNMAFRLEESSYPTENYRFCNPLRLFSPQKPFENDDRVSEKWVCCDETYAALFSAIGYHVGLQIAEEKGCAVGLIACHQGASVIQAWLDGDAEARLGISIPQEARYGDHTKYPKWNSAGFLYRHLVQKIAPYTLSYVLWYQGESNASVAEANVYGRLLKELIGQRRTDFADADLPFVVVQLANNRRRAGEAWSTIQAAQLSVSNEVQGVCSVISADVCEDDNIHPPTKVLLSKRIADVVLKTLA